MGNNRITKLDTTKRDLAVTVKGGGETSVPVGGMGLSEAWRKMIEDDQNPGMVLLMADRLAVKAHSVTPSVNQPVESGSVQVDLSRIELIFIALNKHCELVSADDPEKLQGFQKRLQVIEDAIENASVFELIQIGKFIMTNKRLCLTSTKLAQLSEMIFDKLACHQDIKEISDEIACRAGSGFYE